MRVDLEKYREWMAWKRKINQTSIKKIEWYINGKKIKLTLHQLKELTDWEHIGLNNLDFASCVLGEDGIKVHSLTITPFKIESREIGKPRKKIKVLGGGDFDLTREARHRRGKFI